MASIACEVEETDLISDNGNVIPGLLITCTQCNHSVEVYGTSEASARRGAVMLKEECPEKQRNYYVVDWEE